MKAEDFMAAMGQIDDELILEAAAMKTEVHTTMKKTKRVLRTVLIAAVVTALLCTGVVATEKYITGPDKAWKVAQQEIEVMKELGILAGEVNMSAAPERVFPVEAEAQDGYWFGRILNHRYVVGSSTSEYYMHMDVDTATGKITRLSIEAFADANDIPVGTMEFSGQTHNLYRNYDDIFPADLTVDEFCSRLAAYWGFSGYTLSGTRDSFYGYNTQPPSGGMKMMDVPESVYLTVFFEGDQSGVPMYIEKEQFPGRVNLLIGTSHMVG